MTSNGLFPAADDDGCEPVRLLASKLGCDEEIVWACMKGLMVPEWTTPEHLTKTRDHVDALNKSLVAARNLVGSLHRLHEDDRQSLIQAGCVTRPQIEHLCKVLEGDVKWLNGFLEKNPRPGGKNPAAHSVAKVVLRAFRVLGKPISWGNCEGYPTTEYGVVVDYAFAAFGINADWRRPAQAVRDEHLRRQGATMNALVKERTNSSK